MGDEHFDALIVGSGFGGSVMAHRLAEAGRRVCVLERGKSYPPGSFARSPEAMARNLWDPSEGLYGMFDLWSFRGIEALVSSGLGGGSLIYANVLLRKDERWFASDEQERWPLGRADLEPHYDRVEAMLKPQRYPFGHPPYDATPKTRAFHAAAARVGRKAEFPPLAVSFGNEGATPVPGEELREPQGNLHGARRYTCRLCGECDVGCNLGSKNTLDFNYLSAAQRSGADIRTLCEVRSLAPLDRSGYSVTYVHHDPESGEAAPERTVTADRLVLSAGTLGSTYLLLRNRGSLPALSGRLGTRFCGNGDLLTFAVRTAELIDPARGPVITSAIRYEDALDGNGDGRGFYIEDAGYPQFASWLVQATDAPGTLRRAARVLWQVLRQRIVGDPESNLSAEASALFGDSELSANVLPLLGMGRDVPDGTMSLTKRGYLGVDWRKRKSGPYFDRLRAASKELADAMGARSFVDNPIWHLRRVITVHPLGGCPMGETADEGVVDPYGRVFGHPGLHVADGSVMPGPVGANPSLTIAALADRFADAILEDRPVEQSPRKAPAPARRPRDDRIGLSFTEEMKGFITLGESDYDRGFRLGRETRTALMFHLTIETDDLDQFIDDRSHEARADGWIESEALGGRLPVERGVFNLFVDAEGNRRRKRMLYRLFFEDGERRPLTLVGFKLVEDDPGFDTWQDTTTLFTRVLRGRVEPGGDEAAEVVAAGLIHIHALDFARQLTTFRTVPPGRVDAVARFGALFAGDLWEVYGP